MYQELLQILALYNSLLLHKLPGKYGLLYSTMPDNTKPQRANHSSEETGVDQNPGKLHDLGSTHNSSIRFTESAIHALKLIDDFMTS